MSIGQANIDKLRSMKFEPTKDDKRPIKKITIGKTNVLSPPNMLETRVIKEKEISYEIHENIKSIRLKDHKFTNYLKNKQCKEYDIVKKIFDLDKKTYKGNEVPIELDGEESIFIDPRHIAILKESDIYENYNNLDKAKFGDAISRTVHGLSRQQPVRIVIDNTNPYNKKIVLIDLYHLFASNNKLEENYRERSAFHLCMKTVLTEC